MSKDWTGNRVSAFKTIGATGHADHGRAEHDYYATDPLAIDCLLEVATPAHHIWECACGEGHLAKRLTELGYDVYSTDLIDRGFGIGGVDFLAYEGAFDGDILTNPPYKHAQEFVEKALGVIPEGNSAWFFLKLTFLEGAKRYRLFKNTPPKNIYVASRRIKCWFNGEEPDSASAVCYAWFQFEKGWYGDTKVSWMNTGE